MSKRIVFCADGTWEDADNDTNVYRLYKALTIASDQLPLYDDGVGATGDPVWKMLGGAFGTGLWQKIKDGYTKIAHVYEEGDDVFIFGFSRGAYTARSLAGMIAICGLPTQDFSDAMVDTAFSAYRERDHDQRAAILATLSGCHLYDARIKMVGVWDTVGSLGIPAVFGLVDPLVYGFLDTGLHPDVLNAFHAMAIDEKRCEFPATLWTSVPAPGQALQQVWFTGTHGDVGGGVSDGSTATTTLSDITLAWMMNHAAALGLEFDAAVIPQYPMPMDPKFALDTLHPTWGILWGFPRDRDIAGNATLGNSVAVRCQYDTSYRPSNLNHDNGVLSSSYEAAVVVAQPQTAAAKSGS